MNLQKAKEILDICVMGFKENKTIELIDIIPLYNKEYNIITSLDSEGSTKVRGDIYISDLSYDIDLFGFEIKLCKKTNDTLENNIV